MIKGIIDRFEGEYAVVEIEGVMKIVKHSDLPAEAQAGDVLIFDKNQWQIDNQGTEKLKQNIDKLANELWE